jgi:hypothetical protein
VILPLDKNGQNTATNPATAEAAITALSRAAQLIQPVQPERLH